MVRKGPKTYLCRAPHEDVRIPRVPPGLAWRGSNISPRGCETSAWSFVSRLRPQGAKPQKHTFYIQGRLVIFKVPLSRRLKVTNIRSFTKDQHLIFKLRAYGFRDWGFGFCLLGFKVTRVHVNAQVKVKPYKTGRRLRP